nr:MAG TPA: hypothetical protein [Caudoviricetes sp.]
MTILTIGTISSRESLFVEIRVQRLSKAFYSRIEEASRVVPSGR